jgi:hypothetical protein
MPSLLRYSQNSLPGDKPSFEIPVLLQNQRYLPSSQASTEQKSSASYSYEKPHVNPPDENIKQSGPPTAAKRWKRLSAPGSFTKRVSWNTDARSNRNAQSNFEDKPSKGISLSERIKQILSPKRLTGPQSFYRPEMPVPKSEFEGHSFKRLSLSLEAQVADFGSEYSNLAPSQTDLDTLAVLASLPGSTNPSLSNSRSRVPLVELSTARRFKLPRDVKANEGNTAYPPQPDRLTLPDVSQKDSAWASGQPYHQEVNQISLYEANRSDIALLDGIVDFFESYGAGFRLHCSDLDTLDMDSPAKVDLISEVCVFKERTAEPATLLGPNSAQNSSRFSC